MGMAELGCESFGAEGMDGVEYKGDRVKTTRREALDHLADSFMDAMRSGVTPPWAKSWRSVPTPRSGANGRPYSGFNRLFLELVSDIRDYQSPYWVTRSWVEKRGGLVPAHAGGVEVIAIFRVGRNRETGEDSNALAATGFVVYNVEEIFKEVPRWEPPPLDEKRFAKARHVVDSYLKGDEDRKGPHLAYDRSVPTPRYSIGWDTIRMPGRWQFETSDGFYHTLLHEAAHSTGHHTRLARPGVVNFDHFGSYQYGDEELVAEMTAALLARETGIDNAREELMSASYLESWLGSMGESPDMLVRAIEESERAAKYLMRFSAPKDKKDDKD